MNTLDQENKYKFGAVLNKLIDDCDRTLSHFIKVTYNAPNNSYYGETYGRNYILEESKEALYADSYAYKDYNIATPRNLLVFIQKNYKISAHKYLSNIVPKKYIKTLKLIVNNYPSLDSILSENESLGLDYAEGFLSTFYSYICYKNRNSIYKGLINLIQTGKFSFKFSKLSEGYYGVQDDIICDVASLFEKEDESELMECSICYELMNYRNTEELSCSHCFHYDCIQKIKKSNRVYHKCPLCRGDL